MWCDSKTWFGFKWILKLDLNMFVPWCFPGAAPWCRVLCKLGWLATWEKESHWKASSYFFMVWLQQYQRYRHAYVWPDWVCPWDHGKVRQLFVQLACASMITSQQVLPIFQCHWALGLLLSDTLWTSTCCGADPLSRQSTSALSQESNYCLSLCLLFLPLSPWCWHILWSITMATYPPSAKQG